MTTNVDIADFIRTSFTKGMLSGMQGPTTFFADRFEVHYVPARSTDGWFEGQRLRDYQTHEYDIIRQVLPDARLTDVVVVPRADDQVIVIMTLTGSLHDGSAFSCPITMVYDVEDGEIVRVIGLYNQQKLEPFADAFEEAARTIDIPTEMAPRR